LAGSAAVAVGQELGAGDDVGLAEVVGGHGHLAGGEALGDGGEDGGVAVEGATEGFGDGFAGEVVLGGAEAAGEEDDVGAGQGDAHGAGEVVEIVAHDCFEGDGDADLVEGLGEIEGIGVLPEGGEHLRSGGDYLCDHEAACDSWRAWL